MNDVVLTLVETSRILGISTLQLREYIDAGHLKRPRETITGQAAFYLASDMPELRRQLEQKKNSGTTTGEKCHE
ncbi:MAG: MerR family transcriptional regulator [Candidatus Abyssobacteria bacterium SURF_17]|uniref:MerR family transcriptional regulator n=1 Tax=Candidatus Abyssobacteria bacterium SURF_17 TaxID=2093361 RepID=A0A419EUV1_9BACT|nr:MAG: MerR family transcriptional regulator [Candidatus Abyssubacteria bacterium SURF_17]